MRTGNIGFLPNQQNASNPPSINRISDRSFQDVFNDRMSPRENSRDHALRDHQRRDKPSKARDAKAKDLKDLDETKENRLRRRNLEELKALLSLVKEEELEIPEELQALLHEISNLVEEIQLILGEWIEQGVLSEATADTMDFLGNLQGPLESLTKDKIDTLENATKVLEGLEQITEEVSHKVENPQDLEKLLKAQAEIKTLMEEALSKAATMKETLENNFLRKPEVLPVKMEESTKNNKASEELQDTTKTQGETTEEGSKEEVTTVNRKSNLKEKDPSKEDMTSRAAVTLETKEEQPLERSFLFSQDRVENFEKLSAMVQKENQVFGQNLSQMIEEMTEKISIMKNGEASEIKMQLVPNNLGKLVIQLSTDENILSARVYADTPKVKEMIEGQLEELKEALIDKGLTVESLEVFVGHEQDRALYQKHGPMIMTGQNKSSQISFAEMEAMEEAALKTNPYVEKYQYNRLV